MPRVIRALRVEPAQWLRGLVPLVRLDQEVRTVGLATLTGARWELGATGPRVADRDGRHRPKKPDPGGAGGGTSAR